jgi:hypothetical protein
MGIREPVLRAVLEYRVVAVVGGVELELMRAVLMMKASG